MYSELESWVKPGDCHWTSEFVLLRRLRNHLTACVALPTTMGTITIDGMDISGRELGGFNLAEPVETGPDGHGWIRHLSVSGGGM